MAGLPPTAFLPDTIGRTVFVWAPTPPLGLLVLWISGQPANQMAALASLGSTVLHLGLPLRDRGHPAHDFHGVGGWALIVMPALSGFAQIAIQLVG